MSHLLYSGPGGGVTASKCSFHPLIILKTMIKETTKQVNSLVKLTDLYMSMRITAFGSAIWNSSGNTSEVPGESGNRVPVRKTGQPDRLSAEPSGPFNQNILFLFLLDFHKRSHHPEYSSPLHYRHLSCSFFLFRHIESHTNRHRSMYILLYEHYH